jgi:hypothetical protein
MSKDRSPPEPRIQDVREEQHREHGGFNPYRESVRPGSEREREDLRVCPGNTLHTDSKSN